jgi:hypothetical protein
MFTLQVEPRVHVWPFGVIALFAKPAFVSVPLIANWTFDPEGFEALIVMPVTAAPFWKLIGVLRALPPLTVMLSPPPQSAAVADNKPAVSWTQYGPPLMLSVVFPVTVSVPGSVTAPGKESVHAPEPVIGVAPVTVI